MRGPGLQPAGRECSAALLLTLRISALRAPSPTSVSSFSSRPPPAPAATNRPATATGLVWRCVLGWLGSRSLISPVATYWFRPASPPAKPPVAPAAEDTKAQRRARQDNVSLSCRELGRLEGLCDRGALKAMWCAAAPLSTQCQQLVVQTYPAAAATLSTQLLLTKEADVILCRILDWVIQHKAARLTRLALLQLTVAANSSSRSDSSSRHGTCWSAQGRVTDCSAYFEKQAHTYRLSLCVRQASQSTEKQAAVQKASSTGGNRSPLTPCRSRHRLAAGRPWVLGAAPCCCCC